MSRYVSLFSGVAVFVLLTGGGIPCLSAEERELQLAVTSDMHAWYSSTFLYPRKKPTGLGHLAPIIQRERKNYPDLILLDGGDLLQGSPLAYYYNFIHQGKAEENPFFRLFTQLNYDAVTVGNHDFEVLSVLRKKYFPGSSTPWLGANVESGEEKLFKPYVILSRQGLRIAVLGLTSPAVPMWVGKKEREGLRFEDLATSAKKWLLHLRKKENPDLIIGLIHSGDDPVRDDENTKLKGVPPANAIFQLLSSISGFDLVLYGHSHSWPKFNPDFSVPYIFGIPAVALGKKGERLIRLKMKVSDRSGKWQITKLTGSRLRPERKTLEPKTIREELGKGYLEYMQAGTPWRLSERIQTGELSQCINELQGMALDEAGVDGTLLPYLRIHSVNMKPGEILLRSHLFLWSSYDNKAVSVSLSKRDIYLLSQPYVKKEERQAVYNQILFPWITSKLLKNELSGSFEFWWPGSEDWQRKYHFKVSDYHFHGGGGVFSAIFYPQMNEAEPETENIRDQLFRLLTRSDFRMPDSCGFFVPSERDSRQIPALVRKKEKE